MVNEKKDSGSEEEKIPCVSLEQKDEEGEKLSAAAGDLE